MAQTSTTTSVLSCGIPSKSWGVAIPIPLSHGWMMIFIIDDEDNDPYDRLQLMLELMSELLPGTDVYKLYDRIISTCADPKRA
jgi:hypothetical protein